MANKRSREIEAWSADEGELRRESIYGELRS
jgi:hypothetical protein